MSLQIINLALQEYNWKNQNTAALVNSYSILSFVQIFLFYVSKSQDT